MRTVNGIGHDTRSQGYVSVMSRRHNDWQTLAFEATADREEVLFEAYEDPMVDWRSYPTPIKALNAKRVRKTKRRKTALLTNYNLIEM